MTTPKILRYAGFGEESTFGTAVPPSFDVDIASATLDAPSESQMVFEGSRGRGQHLHRPGFYSTAGNVVYATDIRTMTHLFKWGLGGYAFDEDSPLNTHECWGTDDRVLPSFTTRLGKDVFEHVFSGCCVDSLQLSVSDGWMELTVEIIGQKDAKQTIRASADLNVPDEYPLSYIDASCLINNVNESAEIRSLELNIGNNLQAEQGRGLGLRHPQRIPAEGRETTLSLGLWYEDTKHLERVWGDSDGPAAGGSAEVPVEINIDAGADGSAKLELPRVLFTGVQLQPSGRSEIEQSISASCFGANVELADEVTTVNTDILATFQNTQDEI